MILNSFNKFIKCLLIKFKSIFLNVRFNIVFINVTLFLLACIFVDGIYIYFCYLVSFYFVRSVII